MSSKKKLSEVTLKKVWNLANIGQTAVSEIAAEISQTDEMKAQGGISYSVFRERVIKDDAVRQKIEQGFSRGKNRLLSMLYNEAYVNKNIKVAQWLLENVYGITKQFTVDLKNSDGSLKQEKHMSQQQVENIAKAVLKTKTDTEEDKN